jgi:branched-chain amino acid transport system substrate-binding protein
MKKLLGLVSAAAVGFVMTVSASQAADPIRMPFIQTFSGPYIDFGERMWREGVLPALEVINNEQGGINGRPLEFYKVDNYFPDTARFLNDFRRICADPSIPIAYGVGATKTTIAVFEDVKRCKIPTFNPSSGGAWPHKKADGSKDFGGWLFRYQPQAEETLPGMFKLIQERLGLKTASISHTNDDDFAVNNRKIALKALAALNVKIVADVSTKTKETNFASQVAAVNSSRPDAHLLLHQPGDAGTMTLQLRDRGFKSQLMADVIIAGEDLWILSKGKAVGMIGYSTYAVDDNRPIVQAWLKTWRKATGKKRSAPDGFVTAYYEGTLILADILRGVSDLNSREEIRDGFLKIKNREAITGTISWPTDGDLVRSQPILVQRDAEGLLKKWPN